MAVYASESVTGTDGESIDLNCLGRNILFPGL